MIRTLFATVAALSLTLSATAPAAAETTQDCLKATFEVAKKAQDKSPTEAQISTLEALLGDIEELCDGGKYADAATKRKELQTLVASMS